MKHNPCPLEDPSLVEINSNSNNGANKNTRIVPFHVHLLMTYYLSHSAVGDAKELAR